MNIVELRQKKAGLVKEARSLLERVEKEKREGLSAEEQTQYDKTFKEIDSLTDTIGREERLNAQELELAKRTTPDPIKPDPGNSAAGGKGITEETRALALQGWLRTRTKLGLEERHLEAGRQCGIDLAGHAPRDLELNLLKNPKAEYRALSAVTGSAGAFTIPEGFIPNLEVALLEFGGVRKVAEILRTTEGNRLPWPTSNDTTNKGVIVGENVTQDEQDTTFGAIHFDAYKYSSKLIKVPFELLQDSAIDLASLIGRMLGERIGRIQNDHFTTGNGSGQPKGIVTASSLGVTASSATAIKADEIVDLLHSVDPAYRIGAGFMFHDSILQTISKLKDGQGRYLFGGEGLNNGTPTTLKGFPFTINQSMDSTVASGKKTILFGQLSKYKIRDVSSIRLLRLEERFADSDQIAFVAFLRSDGNLVDAGVAPVKHMVH